MTDTELGRQLTETLSLLRQTIGFSRARLYVMDEQGAFRLAASCGFPLRFGPEEVLGVNDPLIEWVQLYRKPAYANSIKEAGPLARVMERESYARLLAAPISDGARTAAIVELQDKVAGGLFTADDARLLERAVKHFRTLLQTSTEGGTRPAVAGAPGSAGDDPGGDREIDSPVEAGSGSVPQPPDEEGPLGAEVSAAARAEPPRAEPPKSELTRRETLVCRGFINTLLLSAEIEVVVFSLWSAERAEVYVGARRPFSDPGRSMLVRELDAAIRAAAPGFSPPREKRFNTEYPFGPGAGEIREFAGAQTSLVSLEPVPLLLTIVFARAPAPTLTAALTEMHRLVRAAFTDVRAASRYRGAYRSLVNFLLEPGTKAYPQLKSHGLAAAFLARRFATHLKLPAETVEQITVAGLLHDIGLRELELPYDRLSGRRPLDLEEIAIVRKHPAVAAALLERIEFPYSVVSLVRHHHERWDGSGYPDRLTGEEIPFGSRLLAIVEAYDAMTSADSYRSPISREDALQIILQKGGTQFDPQLVEKFAELLREDLAGDAAPPVGGYRETKY